MIQNLKSEPAVSPIIGTILLVAIAVVLVAIILVVVMGFSGDTNEKKVGLNAKSASGNDATLILYGGTSIDELIKLEMIDQDSSESEYVEFWNITNGSAYVGVPYLAKDVARPDESMDIYDTKINVRGTFRDGSEVILLVQPMTFYDAEKYSAPVFQPPMIGAGYITAVYLDEEDITNLKSFERKIFNLGGGHAFLNYGNYIQVTTARIEIDSPIASDFKYWGTQLISDRGYTTTANREVRPGVSGSLSQGTGRSYIGEPKAKTGNWTFILTIYDSDMNPVTSHSWDIIGIP